MSRGKKVFFSGLALLGLSSFLVYASPADAAITVSSGTAAGVDNLAPGPVGTVTVVPDLGVPNVTVTWTLAADDFGRSAPAGSDFTSGGVFVSVNDVAGYNVWRRPVGGENVLVATVGPGNAAHVDATVAAGLTYIFSVTAIDGSGNESSAVESEQISLGPPPAGGKPTVPPGSVVSKAARLRLDAVLPPIDLQAQFRADIRAALAALLGVDVSRIIIKGLSAGSVIIDFEITDDPADPAEDAAARLETAVAADPNAFVGVEGAGPVLDLGLTNASSVDFGAVAADAVASDTFTFTNTASDPEAVLSVTAATTGAGYSTSVATLSLAAGETGSFDVSFTAAAVGNLNGAYAGTLQILTNDPNNRETNVALSSSISAGLNVANIVVSGAIPSNFGQVTIGLPRTLTVNIDNSGDLDLTGSLAVEGDSTFTIDTSSFVLAGGETVAVGITFTPVVAGAASGTLVITSDDENEPTVSVALSATAIDPGDIPQLIDADGNVVLGDFDGSAAVTFDDFFIFADNFGQVDFNPATDLDADGDVDFDDFFSFADNFGKSGTYVGG